MAVDIRQDGIIKFTEKGVETTNRDSILNYLLDEFKVVYGANAYIELGTEDYNMISLLADVLNDMGVTAVQVANGYSLTSATGFQLDNIASIFYGNISRIQAKPSTMVVMLYGTAGTVVQNGKLVDALGGFWNLPKTVTIGSLGQVWTTATYSQAGAYVISPNQLSGSSAIATPQEGWTSVQSSELRVGVPYETDTVFRTRLALEQHKPAQSSLASLQANLYALSANDINYVEKVSIWENDTNSTKSFLDVGLLNVPAHSILVSVYGYNLEEPISNHLQDIGEAIYAYKGQGVGTDGGTNVYVNPYGDNATLNGGSQTLVRFVEAHSNPLFVFVNVLSLKTSSVTSTDIQSAISEVLSTEIGKIHIGGKLFAINLVAGVQNAINNAFGEGLFQVTGITFETADGETELQGLYDESFVLSNVTVTIS